MRPALDAAARVIENRGVRHRCVIFDLGGVVLGSPLHAIAAYERDQGIEAGLVNRVVVASGPQGAWSRLERGELALADFYAAFERDCQTAGARLSARALMARIAEVARPHPGMLEALVRIRGRGLLTAALTNTWSGEGDGDRQDEGLRSLAGHFDFFIESSAVGLRKPDPRIYTYACDEIGIEPREAVFLDDIGRNLKSARELGMTTIKVEDPEVALGELEAVLGFPLAHPPGD